MPEQLGYRIYRNDDPHYSLLEIEILGDRADRPEVTFHWQAHYGDDRKWSEWYAFRFVIDKRDLDQLARSVGIVKRILRNVPEREPSPARIIEKIGRLGFEQVVYDGRVHAVLPVAAVAGPEHNHWMDQIPGEQWSHVGVLARDVEEAKRLITVELAQNCRDEILKRFLEAGKTVRCTNEIAPDVTRAMKLIRLGEENDG